MLNALRLLNTQRKNLEQSFFPVGKQTLNEDDDDIPYDALSDDIQHTFECPIINAWLQIGWLRYFRIRATTNLMKLPPQHRFVQHLMSAYRNDYGINIMDSGTKPFQLVLSTCCPGNARILDSACLNLGVNNPATSNLRPCRNQVANGFHPIYHGNHWGLAVLDR